MVRVGVAWGRGCGGGVGAGRCVPGVWAEWVGVGSVGLGVGTVCCAGGRMVPVSVLWYRWSVGPVGAGRCVPGVWPK